MTDYNKLYEYLSARAEESENWAQVACDCENLGGGHFSQESAIQAAMFRTLIRLSQLDAPSLLILAQAYKHRDDFDEEWSLESKTYEVSGELLTTTNAQQLDDGTIVTDGIVRLVRE